jgi:NAD(P)-dependent dehydrogenase (short-subunit alcohol dehydrogenase family)
MHINLYDKVAIITGATSGIGEATAKVFLESGAKIMLTGRNEQKLENLKLSCGENGKYNSGNIADPGFRASLIDQTIKEFGKLDILINAAGIIGTGTIENTSLEDYEHMLGVNLKSVFHLCQLAIPHLEKTEGTVINISSVAGLRSFPGIFSYSVSKAGLDQLTRCAALELASKKIRVNAVNPGVVETNLHKRSGMSKEKYDKFLEHSKVTHPIGRVGQPKDIAELIAFLASDSAGWITGVTYSIDGGRAQTCFR